MSFDTLCLEAHRTLFSLRFSTSNKITMKYCSILVFIALLSPRHVVLADKTSRRNLRVQRHQAYAHEHAPTRTRRLGKQNEANASSVDKQQGGKRGRNKKGKAGKTAPLDQLDPNNQIIQLDEPITLPAPSTSVSSYHE